jgi:hypothetical protein
MVRRGSTVRVRQRAFDEAAARSGFSVAAALGATRRRRQCGKHLEKLGDASAGRLLCAWASGVVFKL